MITVVIPVYLSKQESFAMTEKCISLAKENSTSRIEWIIVETGSDFFKDEADIHIYEKERSTCTKSINRGFKLATGNKVVLLTNDVYLKPGWDTALEDAFKIDDCGMATVATTQLRHSRENVIKEGIWCSVFMIPNALLKQLGYFDENYVNSWDDSDLIMRVYLQGLKMYRNYNVVVDHLIGATHYEDAKHIENYNRNMKYFKDKYEQNKEHRMYKILTEGWVI